MGTRVKLERTEIVYDQERDELGVLTNTPSGAIIHSCTASALHSLVAWASHTWAYEPWIYRKVMGAWRGLKKWILRRPVCQGHYRRTIYGSDGYIVVDVKHYQKEPIKFLTFLKRKV